jgi:hypothetical protein
MKISLMKPVSLILFYTAFYHLEFSSAYSYYIALNPSAIF